MIATRSEVIQLHLPSRKVRAILPLSTAPNLSEIVLQQNGSCVLTFSAELGHTYRLEYKDELTEAGWHPMDTNQFATSITRFFVDTATAPQRFYRVVLVE